jgi:hypothetical protein
MTLWDHLFALIQLRSTQSLTEMSTGYLRGGKALPGRTADTFSAILSRIY